MALFKTPEEREAEARQREEEQRRQVDWNRRQQEAAAQAQAEAVFAASPAGRARAAFARGDRFFQIELEVSALTGGASLFGSSDNQVTPRSGSGDALGRVEDEGWRLEHTGFVFVDTGSTSTERVLFSGEGTVTRGSVVGIYLFRRAPQPSDAGGTTQ